MPDIRDVLKGLSIDDRALYTEIRTAMRRSYLSAHSKLLHIDKYEATDDAFLDLIDIKLAMLFDRAGAFDSSVGNIDEEQGKAIEHEVKSTFEQTAAAQWLKQEVKNSFESTASRMIAQPLAASNPWPVQNKAN